MANEIVTSKEKSIVAEIEQLILTSKASTEGTNLVIDEFIAEQKRLPQSLEKAFKLMLSERGIYKKIGIPQSTLGWYRNHFKNGGNVSEAKMRDMLEKAGWGMVQEEKWKIVKAD
jgi:hypothetical protein